MFWVIAVVVAGLLSGLVGWNIGGHATAAPFTLAAVLAVLGARNMLKNRHAILFGTLLAGLAGYYWHGFATASLCALLAFPLQLAFNDFRLKRNVFLPVALFFTFLVWWYGWYFWDPVTGLIGALITFLVQVTINDYYLQYSHAVRRNWPLIGWCRYGFELIGDELRQYWFNTDTYGWPNREQAHYLYRSAKGVNNNLGFGTKSEYRSVGEIHIKNAMFPVPEGVSKGNRLPPLIMGKKRNKPYHCPWPLAISGMSWGALSAEAVMAMASGAKEANIHMLTGEGGLTPYHRDGVVKRVPWSVMCTYWWQVCLYYLTFTLFISKPEKPKAEVVGGPRIGLQLGPALFGFRKFVMDPFDTASGREFRKRWTNDLDIDRLIDAMLSDQVVFGEVKMAQGGKPGQGGKLPKEKITKELAEWRGIPMDQDCYSPNSWKEFHDPLSLAKFLTMLQEKTGKPWGIKIVVGNIDEVRAIAKIKKETGMGPDFITIDGGEGGTGAAPAALADHAGLPLFHAIPLVDNALREFGVRDDTLICASGRILDGADIAIAMALGADIVNRGRANMVFAGCILAFRCHTNTCPVGVATQDPRLRRGLDPQDKYVKVANGNLVAQRELLMMCRTAGVRTPWELTRHHLTVVTAPMEEKCLADIYPYPDGSNGKRNLDLGDWPEDDPEENDRFGPRLIQIGLDKVKRK